MLSPFRSLQNLKTIKAPPPPPKKIDTKNRNDVLKATSSIDSKKCLTHQRQLQHSHKLKFNQIDYVLFTRKVDR